MSEQRQREIEIIEGLADHLRNTTFPLKMLTLVTKQDLWWGQRDQVREFYEQGEYATFIERIQQVKGQQNFVHEFAYVSLTLQNLRTHDGKEIALTTAGYDDLDRFENLEKVTQIVERFVVMR
ncbi:MAG: hypothetical protein OHK0029_33420 [Armatimonadaceae bacterium]